MYRTRTFGPFSQFGILLGLFGAGLVIGGLFTIMLVHWITGLPVMQTASILSDEKYVQVSRLAQVVGAFFMLGLPAIVFAVILARKPFSYLGFSISLNLKQLFLILLLLFAALFASGGLGELNQLIPLSKGLETTFKNLEDEYTKQVMILAHMRSAADYFFSLVILALLPAMFEEMFFRGALQQVMVQLTRNVFAGILVTSILFSAIHASWYGFLPRLFLGMLLGYIFYYGKNIWLNILLHFLNNAFAITQMYYLSSTGKLNAESMNETFPLYYGLLGIIGVLAIMVVYKKESMKFREKARIKEMEEEQFYNIH